MTAELEIDPPRLVKTLGNGDGTYRSALQHIYCWGSNCANTATGESPIGCNNVTALDHLLYMTDIVCAAHS